MAIGFLPGEPNKSPQAVANALWKNCPILTYCSGNNLVILSHGLTYLQTIYLDTDAFAVDINPDNGFIAVAIGTQVHIYEPMNEFMKIPRWQLLTKLINQNDSTHVNALHWGSNNEIVVGSDFLTLWQVKKDFGIPTTQILWSLIQANPVYLVKISHDTSLIASCSKYDRLLKVWNRLRFGENSSFDLTYLSHTAPVSMIRWKITSTNNKQDHTNVLYSVSEDQVLRIWSSYVYDNAQNIQIWGTLKINDTEKEIKKFALLIDDRLVSQSLKTSINKLYNEKETDLQNDKQPDLLFVIGQSGSIEVFALGNLSQNPPKMIHIKSLKKLKFNENTFTKNAQYINFPEVLIDPQDKDIQLIVHDLNGTIRNIKFDLNFLVSKDDSPIGTLTHRLTGHNKSIQKIFRTSDGSAMMTTSRFEENCIWIPEKLLNQVTLKKKSVVQADEPISKAVLFDKGTLLLAITGNELVLWDTSNKIAQKLNTFKVSHHDGPPLFFASIPFIDSSHLKHYVIAIFKDGARACLIENNQIKEFQVAPLPIGDKEIHRIAPIDPVGQVFKVDRPIISVIDSQGVLECFSGKIENNRIEWVSMNILESKMSNTSYIRGSSISKFAIVDESKLRLTIWDLTRNVLEYEEVFEDPIRDIDWTSTFSNQSILAVGFEDYSLLYTQQRYDYTNRTPAFQVIKRIDITNYTSHSIGDSIWLKDGTLVVGSGNQMFISDKQLDLVNDKFTRKSIGSRKIVTNDIFNLSSVLNGILPLYHPQFLIQLLFQGKFSHVKEILLRLFLNVRKLELEGETIDTLDSNLGFDILKLLNDVVDEDGSSLSELEEPYNKFNTQICELLKEKLTNHSLPYLTRHQQITLLSTIESVDLIDQNTMSLDENGLRFFLSAKLFQLHKGSQSKLSMRDISWALHSENKELLLSLIQHSVKDRRITWSTAKDYGLAHWVKYDELISTIETVAKNEFTLPEKRDPSKCAIYYLALKKKQILIGLWKTSVGHSEQQKMLTFLKNDFKESRWRSAALKNAFVLLSKHRYMDAACFFLLAESLKDCVNVILKQLKDVDLAVAVARIYEGDNGPVLRSILTQHLLSNAVSIGDRWTTSYIYWKLNDKSRSIQSLVKSPVEVITEEERSGITLTEKSKSFLEDDPLLMVLYQNLREKSLHYFHGSLEISSKIEFDFILRVSNIYTRMGCDYLSVALLGNWKFLKYEDSQLKKKKKKTKGTSPTSPTYNKNALEKYGLSPMARRRSSLLTGNREEFLQAHKNDLHVVENNNSQSMSILEKYGLASNSIKREEELKDQTKNKVNKHTPPPQDAFKEPDMSAFDFGF